MATKLERSSKRVRFNCRPQNQSTRTTKCENESESERRSAIVAERDRKALRERVRGDTVSK